MSLLIQEIPATNAPIGLLLLADPSEEKIRSYLPKSKCFVALSNEAVVAACLVQPIKAGIYEIMSIAVQTAYQQAGYGTALLTWIIDFYRRSDASEIRAGTGTFGYQLAFYQKHGFRVTSIDHDFFIKNYPEPLFEDGIPLFDMLRLTLSYSGRAD